MGLANSVYTMYMNRLLSGDIGIRRETNRKCKGDG